MARVHDCPSRFSSRPLSCDVPSADSPSSSRGSPSSSPRSSVFRSSSLPVRAETVSSINGQRIEPRSARP
ncbi:hypothetical protein RHA1_ro06174 [Rhodococcus jostii RHA1]|uniref:Uncharacterized protein n=1 Tax=Rhodococcus jostii (strain RHA1) TaxID=101510 RepID=Q0S3D5_RHOJR|nr:hypothetical protein RHA1_ro06174 [Rhodococcus jostii RHA1]